MPSLHFETKAATLFNNSHYDGTSPLGRLSLKATLPPDDRLELDTGETAKDLELVVNFTAMTPSYREWLDRNAAEKGKAIGRLDYFDNTATVMADCYLPASDMDRLIEFASRGRYPTFVRVRSENPALTFGYDPGGCDVKWATKEARSVLLESVEYGLVIEPWPESLDPDERPVTPIGADLLPTLLESLKWQRWSFWLLVALGVIISLRAAQH